MQEVDTELMLDLLGGDSASPLPFGKQPLPLLLIYFPSSGFW